MNAFVAAVTFLLETVLAAEGGLVTITYSPTLPGVPGVDLGHKTVASGFLAGYYTVHVKDVVGTSPTDDFTGSIHVAV